MRVQMFLLIKYADRDEKHEKNKYSAWWKGSNYSCMITFHRVRLKTVTTSGVSGYEQLARGVKWRNVFSTNLRF